MLRGEGNGEQWKTTIGLISITATLHVPHTFFVHNFAAVLHDYNVKLLETSKTLFTRSGGPRSSGVGFFCFHALEDTKQKKPTPVDQGPPHGYMVCLWYGLKVGRVYGHVIITKFSWMGRSALNPIGRSPFLSSWNLHKVELFSAIISHLRDISSWKCSWKCKSFQFETKKIWYERQ